MAWRRQYAVTQAYLGHRNIQNTTRYSARSATMPPFPSLWTRIAKLTFAHCYDAQCPEDKGQRAKRRGRIRISACEIEDRF